MKSRRTCKHISFGVVAVSVIAFGYFFLRDSNQAKSDAYAQWWVATLVVEHMERNGGLWPRRWEDLRVPFEVCAGRTGTVWDFGELRGRVAIDFGADPAELFKASGADGKPPFRVIWLRHDKNRYWVGQEPNSMILQYLHERKHRSASYKYPMPADPSEQVSRQVLLGIGARFEVNDEGHVSSVNMNGVNTPGWSDVMTHLTPLRDLRKVQLCDANVTDDALVHLKDIPNLEELVLYRTKVTDEGLRCLPGMGKLRSLCLADEVFTDASLNYIRRLDGLRFLNLNGAKITDTGLTRLYDLKKLEQILLGGTRVTPDGFRHLRKALPNCDVYHD